VLPPLPEPEEPPLAAAPPDPVALAPPEPAPGEPPLLVEPALPLVPRPPLPEGLPPPPWLQAPPNTRLANAVAVATSRTSNRPLRSTVAAEGRIIAALPGFEIRPSLNGMGELALSPADWGPWPWERRF
jgi:hypothetical protein